jgi:hypothetical protein
MQRPIIFSIMLVAMVSCPAAEDTQPAVRALFIGNSLTYVNNVPAMIEAIAASAGLKGRVTCRGVAMPDFGLVEHWGQGDALRGIQNGRWTHVVLQQGPSSQADSRKVLREYAKRFAFEAKAKGARVVMYGVWPSRDRLDVMDAVTESYRLAAADAKGSLVAAGEGWRAAWRRDPELPLYGPDQFHPSPMGSYLAALMLFEHLTGHPVVGLPPPDVTDRALKDVKVTAAQLKILQEAAAEANAATAVAR